MNRFPRFSAGIAVLLSLFMVGCSNSGLITALDVAEVAASSAVPVIQAFSPQLGPATVQLLTNYVQAISNACSQSVTELNSADTQAIKDTKIAGYFANVAAISLPAGTASEVQAVISAIGAAVNIILTQLHPATPTPTASVRSSQSDALLAQYQAQVKALGSSKARLQDIQTRARQMSK